MVIISLELRTATSCIYVRLSKQCKVNNTHSDIPPLARSLTDARADVRTQGERTRVFREELKEGLELEKRHIFVFSGIAVEADKSETQRF